MQPRLAVLIDADNISASHAPAIFAHIGRLGAPIVRRVYGRPSAMTDWTSAAQLELCELRPQASVAPGKNGTDIALVIDAVDIAHGGIAQAFCIVSNDRDFVPLAIRLRATGNTVHAICGTADERYAKAFDTVLELTQQPLVDAFRKITNGRAPELSLGEAGKLLREHLPGVIPTTGKMPLRKALEGTGRFAFTGTGTAIRVRLVGR